MFLEWLIQDDHIWIVWTITLMTYAGLGFGVSVAWVNWLDPNWGKDPEVGGAILVVFFGALLWPVVLFGTLAYVPSVKFFKDREKIGDKP